MKHSIVYTGTGDNGTTSLVGGQRIAKDDIRIEAYGTVDELNSYIGVVDSLTATDNPSKPMLRFIQNRLFNIGAYLASVPSATYTPAPGVDAADVERIETMIDVLDADLPAIRRFILPGGTPLAAQCHVARTVARRAERRIITLAGNAPIDPQVVKFINRLSDFLFVLSRFNNHNASADEIFWDKDC